LRRWAERFEPGFTRTLESASPGRWRRAPAAVIRLDGPAGVAVSAWRGRRGAEWAAPAGVAESARPGVGQQPGVGQRPCQASACLRSRCARCR